MKREDRAQAAMAWHMARMISFTKTLEPLAQWLDPPERTEEEDADLAWHKMKMWAKAYGQVIEEG